MSDVLWQLEGVTLRGTSTPRLSEVTLTIRPGVTAVLGYSGAGKTSLLNVLVGFEKPDRGAVRSRPRGEGRLAVFWSPQDGGLWSHLTAREHLAHVAGRAREDLLEGFDLAQRGDARPSELSQGERSRLSIARTLASGARALVMDEPLSHVDPQRVGQYWQLILDTVRAMDSSLVFATHSPRHVLAHADRAVVVRGGEILHEGEVQELYRHPPTQELAASLGECNWFSPGEAAKWMGGAVNGRACYRPEQVVAESDAGSPIVVEAARFEGDVARLEVVHEERQEKRTIYHRPAGDRIRPGDRVNLRVLAVMLMVSLLVGCGGKKGEPTIEAISTHIWSMPPVGATVPAPRHVTILPDGNTMILDTAGRILTFDPAGKLVHAWDMPEKTSGNPEGTCLFKDGRIAVADTHYYRVVFFNGDGEVVSMMGDRGPGPGQFIYPVSIVQDETGDFYVCEYGGNDRVQRFTVDGEFVLSFGGNGEKPGEFQRAAGMVYHEGKLYIADAINNRVQVFTRDGKFVGVLGDVSLQYPYGICMAGDKTLFVIEFGAGRVTHLSLEGKLLGRFGSNGSAIGQFRTPWGIGVEGSNCLRVADTGNRRIVEIKF